MSCLLPHFNCQPDNFRTHLSSHHHHHHHHRILQSTNKTTLNLCFRPQCIFSTVSPSTSSSSSSSSTALLDFDNNKDLTANTPWPYLPHNQANFKATSSAESLLTNEEAVIAAAASSNSNYRPAVILPGLGNNSGDYSKLVQILKDKYGVPTVVAKVSRPDWFRNAAGLVDPNYWRGTLEPTPVLDWYLKRVDDAVEEAKELATGGSGISLIGHSAGGWLARVYMQQFGNSHISLLLTLGTPHLPPPKGVPGVIDQTRGLLDYVQQYCSKPLYTPQLKYVCIAGRYIQGAQLFDKSNLDVEEVVTANGSQLLPEPEPAIINTASTSSSSSSPNPTLRARFVGQGYKQVCGQADVWGDGVVPEVSAHLEGALNISLDGVYHSPVGSNDAFTPWYGSPDVLEQWIQHLLN